MQQEETHPSHTCLPGYDQYVLRAFGEPFTLVHAIQDILVQVDPQSVLQQTGQHLSKLTNASAVIITQKEKQHFKIISSYRTHDASEDAVNKIAPKNSISSIVEQERKPVLWIKGESGEATEWLRYPSHVGVPIFDDQQGIFGSVVLAFESNATPPHEQIAMIEILADTLYLAYSKAVSFTESLALGQAIEKERIAQQLHDSVAQNVFSANITVQQALDASTQDDPVFKNLLDLKTMLLEIKDDIKSIVYDSRDKTVHEHNIETIVNEELAAHLKQSTIPVSCHIDATTQLPEKVLLVLRAVIREALANIRKHSKATSASINLRVLNGRVYTTIIDDGKGISRRTTRTSTSSGFHFGLENIRRLVDQAGGTFKLSKAYEHHGTMLSVSIPLEKEARYE